MHTDAHVHQTGLGLDHDVVSSRFSVRSRLSVTCNRVFQYSIPRRARRTYRQNFGHTRYRRVDEPLVHPPTILVSQTQRREFPGNKVLDEHVRSPDEPLDDRASVGLLEIDGDRSLVSVDGEEVGGFGWEMGGLRWAVSKQGCRRRQPGSCARKR